MEENSDIFSLALPASQFALLWVTNGCSVYNAIRARMFGGGGGGVRCAVNIRMCEALRPTRPQHDCRVQKRKEGQLMSPGFFVVCLFWVFELNKMTKIFFDTFVYKIHRVHFYASHCMHSPTPPYSSSGVASRRCNI